MIAPMKKKKKDDTPASPEEIQKLARLVDTSAKYVNKWRTSNPQFAPKEEKKTEGLVEAGGMMVDPSLKSEYELWRQDKEREQADRRAQKEKRKKAFAGRRLLMLKLRHELHKRTKTEENPAPKKPSAGK
jgi:hypothetical protein